jgi:cysteinyl-tRNA synthetase
MLQTHYRSALDFQTDQLDGAVGTLERLRTCVKNLRWAASNAPEDGYLTEADRTLAKASDEARAEFVRQMDDDFNTAGGLAAIFELVTAANKYLAEAGETIATAPALRAADTICELADVMGVELDVVQSDLPAELVDLARERADYQGDNPDEAAEVLLAARQQARAAKDWGTADAIRDGIKALGLVVEDTPAGARLSRA